MAVAKPPKPNSISAAVFLFLLHFAAALNSPDAQALLILKSTADPNDTVLTSWNSSSDPCTSPWLGVSCLHGRINRIVLEKLDLHGGLPHSIALLTHLRVLSLKENGFSGQVPDLSNLTSLRVFFISHNQFSGEFPVSLSSLTRIYRLDLSYNNFSGSIPLSVNRLTHLLTLRLEENGFSGSISSLSLLGLQDFNVSGNKLTGEIPDSLTGFPATSFINNQVFCGPPLEKCKPATSEPTRPNGVMASPATPKTTVASSPTAMPMETKPLIKPGTTRRSKISTLAIIGIIVGDVAVLGLACILLYCYFWRNNSDGLDSGKNRGSSQVEKIVYSSSPYPNYPGYERGKIVFLDGVRRFELEDLLRASAEMLGKGGLGTTYKAILDDGNAVAVKKLKDLSVNWKKEFEQQMEVLGRFNKHPNLVGLKAYYFAGDEKLLVFSYMPNGNLFWLLHGNRGPGRTPLDWTTRLKIAAGSARGLAFIHSSCKSLKLVHGNIKSTNILIDMSGNPRVSDFGLSVLRSPSSGPKSNGYLAPEASLDGRKLTQKSDVYSFGVLLLELLTGKYPSILDSSGPGPGYGGVVDLPRWVQSVVREEWTAEVFDLELMRYKYIEEEMVGLLQIAMSCTQVSPDQRPRMNHVVKMIEGLRVVEASPFHEMVSSVSDSPAVSEDERKVTD